PGLAYVPVSDIEAPILIGTWAWTGRAPASTAVAASDPAVSFHAFIVIDSPPGNGLRETAVCWLEWAPLLTAWPPICQGIRGTRGLWRPEKQQALTRSRCSAAPCHAATPATCLPPPHARCRAQPSGTTTAHLRILPATSWQGRVTGLC